MSLRRWTHASVPDPRNPHKPGDWPVSLLGGFEAGPETEVEAYVCLDDYWRDFSIKPFEGDIDHLVPFASYEALRKNFDRRLLRLLTSKDEGDGVPLRPGLFEGCARFFMPEYRPLRPKLRWAFVGWIGWPVIQRLLANHGLSTAELNLPTRVLMTAMAALEERGSEVSVCLVLRIAEPVSSDPRE